MSEEATSPRPVVCLAGATGTGKTALSLALADMLDGEIINADSRQVYKDFPIVTAQPDEIERGRATHHLFGFLPSSEKISAGKWLELVAPLLDDLASRGKTPIFVGGTGFYFQALLRGLSSIPRIPCEIAEKFRDAAEKYGLSSLYERLLEIDARYARKIHPNDKNRVLRALEVYEATGKTFSWWHDHSAGRPLASGPLFVLRLDTNELAKRLRRRITLMLERGALREAEEAWKNCPDEKAPAWTGIGPREIAEYRAGRSTLDECLEKWLANTRAYAKRQATWFRGRRESVWIDASRPDTILDSPYIKKNRVFPE